MCKPFVIASWSDPTLTYELCDREKFEEIYRSKGFYIVGDEHRKVAMNRRAARQAEADAASSATDEPVLLSGELAEDVSDSLTGDVIVPAGETVFLSDELNYGDEGDDEPSATKTPRRIPASTGQQPPRQCKRPAAR